MIVTIALVSLVFVLDMDFLWVQRFLYVYSCSSYGCGKDKGTLIVRRKFALCVSECIVLVCATMTQILTPFARTTAAQEEEQLAESQAASLIA